MIHRVKLDPSLPLGTMPPWPIDFHSLPDICPFGDYHITIVNHYGNLPI